MKRASQATPAVAGIELEPVSIEWFTTDAGPCVACKRRVGRGPVGLKRDDEQAGPVCDDCLLELNRDLGMLLMFANGGRELASQQHENGLKADQQRHSLMTFAKIYDLDAQWPWRPIAVLDFIRDYLKRLLKRLTQIPLDAVIKAVSGPTH